MRDDDVLERLARGAEGIASHDGAGQIVRGAVHRRRRRRRIAAGIGGAAAGVLLAVTVPAVLDNDEPTRPGPAQRTDGPRATRGDVYRPAGFLEDVLGGRAVPVLQRHHAARGELFYATIEWQPAGWDGPPFLAAISLERAGDEITARRFEVAAAKAFLDPVHRAAAVEPAGADATVRGVTHLHPGGLAVSVVVCDCGGRDGAVLAPEPPASYAELEEVAGDESWVRDAD